MTNAARHEPEAVAALRAGRDDKVNRLLRLPLPQPYVPSRIEAFRDRKRVGPPPAGKGPKAPARKAPRNPDAPPRGAAGRNAARPARQSGGAARGRGGHHGSGQRYTSHGAGQRPTRRARALEGQRYG
jgi:cell division protein FtsW